MVSVAVVVAVTTPKIVRGGKTQMVDFARTSRPVTIITATLTSTNTEHPRSRQAGGVFVSQLDRVAATARKV